MFQPTNAIELVNILVEGSTALTGDWSGSATEIAATNGNENPKLISATLQGTEKPINYGTSLNLNLYSILYEKCGVNTRLL